MGGQHDVQTWSNGGPNSEVWHEWWIKSYSWRLTKTWQINYTPIAYAVTVCSEAGCNTKVGNGLSHYSEFLIGLSFWQSMNHFEKKRTAQMLLYNSLGRYYSQQICWIAKIWPSVLNRSNLHLLTQTSVLSESLETDRSSIQKIISHMNSGSMRTYVLLPLGSNHRRGRQTQYSTRVNFKVSKSKWYKRW